MGNMRFEKSKFGKFWSGKGFYIALAVCMVAVGGATWAAFGNSSLTSDNSSSSTSSPVIVDWSRPTPVENPVSDLPVVEDPSESSSQKESSVAPSNKTSSEKASSEPSTGTYQYPIGSAVAKPFSGEELIYSQTLKDWRVHDGVDLQGKAGDTVKSMAAGTVKAVETDDMWGTVVIINHGNGILAHYCGVDEEVPVKIGEQVKAGQEIGKLGEIACEVAEDAHLHLRVTQNDKNIDPSTLLSGKAD